LITVSILGHTFTALLDSGSSRSFINQKVGQLCYREDYRPQDLTTPIRLADGTETPIREWYSVPIKIGRTRTIQTFGVMPSLTLDVLIGIDLMAQLGISLPAPPGNPDQSAYECATGHESPEQRFREFLKTELPKFDTVIGPTTLTEHQIRLKTAVPIKQRYRPRNPVMQAIIDKEVEEMERAGVIEPSTSPWSSPVVIAKKKDGRPRFCVDFRKVNEVTEKDAYPLPQIEATLDKLRGAKYLSTIDLKNGYWQVPLAPGSRPITAFTVPGRGLMQFRVMPFGLHSAPATFQRLLDTVLGPELEPHVFVYLDDIIVASQTLDDHLCHLKEVFTRLRRARLKINPEKCRFGAKQLRYLGHLITQDGISTDPEKTEAIARIPPPRGVREVRQFLGMLSWYRRFIENFSKRAQPLTRLTSKKTKWQWTTEEENAFAELKNALTTAPVLACPDFTKTFYLQTDASEVGLGAVLTQYHEGHERVVAYASRTLNGAERNYSVTEKECLAVIWGVRKMRAYLEGYRFVVITDHQALKWLQKLDSPTGRLARWALELQQYDYEIRYRRGILNQVADTLSRHPTETTEETCAINPPRACKWYRRMVQAVKNEPENYPDYCVRKKQLFRRILHSLNKDDAGEEWKTCVSTNDRDRILRENHDAPTAGHLGITKTLARLARSYYWPGMFRDASQYVKNCDSCNKYKPSQQGTPGKMHATPAEHPWQIVAVDLMGPLPRSSKGHVWILAAQDKFTKWTEIRPLRKATATAVTRGVYEDVVLRHGAPKVLISDNGRQFISREFRDMLRETGIQARLTPPYTPQCNPEERQNRVLKTMIAQYTGKNQRAWNRYLPEIQFAVNTAAHESTGYTPAFLNHGHELRTPGSPPTSYLNRPPSTSKRLEQLQAARELARITLAHAFQKQAAQYNLRRREWRPHIGDQVWVKNHELSDKTQHKAAKLLPKFKGPFTVTRILSPVIVDVRDKKGKYARNIHISQLKECRKNIEEKTSPARNRVDVAELDTSPRQYLTARKTISMSVHAEIASDIELSEKFEEMLASCCRTPPPDTPPPQSALTPTDIRAAVRQRAASRDPTARQPKRPCKPVTPPARRAVLITPPPAPPTR